MTVDELITKLQKFDPDHEVVIDLDLDPALGFDDVVEPDKLYEGSNWNVVITIKQ